jgi:hypothetical protein
MDGLFFVSTVHCPLICLLSFLKRHKAGFCDHHAVSACDCECVRARVCVRVLVYVFAFLTFELISRFFTKCDAVIVQFENT